MKNRKYIRNRGYGGSVRTSDQAKVKDVFKRLTAVWKTLANDNTSPGTNWPFPGRVAVSSAPVP